MLSWHPARPQVFMLDTLTMTMQTAPIVKQRQYELSQKKKGLCVCCPKPRSKKSKRYCPRHLKLNRLKQQRHRDRQFGKTRE